jgi:hypothetical protein
MPDADDVRSDWREPLGVHDLVRVTETAQQLAASYECVSPAYGAPGYPHCAACCYGTMIAASSMEEFQTAQVLLAVPELVREIQRLRAQREAT